MKQNVTLAVRHVMPYLVEIILLFEAKPMSYVQFMRADVTACS